MSTLTPVPSPTPSGTNWKTTAFGTLASLCTALGASMAGSKYQPLVLAAGGVFGALFAFFAKDKNITGGSTPQA